MEILAKTHLSDRRHKYRNLDDLRLMTVVHRSHLADTVEETARRFQTEDLGTGHKMPYHIWIDQEGRAHQAVPLSRRAPGAMGVNYKAVHVAVHRDCRVMPLNPAQATKLIEVCTSLANYAGEIYLFGHTEIPDSSRDTNKQCPGRHLNLDGLRDMVRKGFTPYDKQGRNMMMEAKGWVL